MYSGDLLKDIHLIHTYQHRRDSIPKKRKKAMAGGIESDTPFEGLLHL